MTEGVLCDRTSLRADVNLSGFLTENVRQLSVSFKPTEITAPRSLSKSTACEYRDRQLRRGAAND